MRVYPGSGIRVPSIKVAGTGLGRVGARVCYDVGVVDLGVGLARS